MKSETEQLIEKINILISSLEKTNNPTVKFFKGVIDIIENCKSITELQEVLDKHLIHAGRITDYGGFSWEQCKLFNEMWEVANSIYKSNPESK